MLRELSHSRRSFLFGTAALPWAGGSAFTNAAFAQEQGDYRAIVCLHLLGGWDNWSALIPVEEGNHARYAAARPSLSLGRSELAPTMLQPAQSIESPAFAFHPNLKNLHTAFHQGQVSVFPNIGTLVSPITKEQVVSGSGHLPQQLFSHNSQRDLVLSGLSTGAHSGWGGRIGDVIAHRNSSREFTCINAADHSIFLYGKVVRPYAVNPHGSAQLLGGGVNAFGTNAAEHVRAISTTAHTNVLRNEYSLLARRSLEASKTIGMAFSGIDDSQMPELNLADSELASQFRAIARSIGSAKNLGIRRQVFFAEMKNWDRHSGSRVDIATNLMELDTVLGGFLSVLRRWGLANSVTTFTTTDFGRKLVENGNGSDHGWGGAGIVMGGAVDGQKIIGKPPAVGSSTADTFQFGRLIPNTSTDQLAATLAHWMGAKESERTTIVPNLTNYPTNQRLLELFR